MQSQVRRIALLTSFAVILLLLIGSSISSGQTSTEDLASGARQHSYPVLAGQPPGTIVTGSGVHDIPSGSIAITDLGALPAVITVTVGAQVFWVNNTAAPIQISNQSFGGQLYLPMIARPGGQAFAGADTLRLAVLPSSANWISEPITPGGQYGRVFGELGAYPYYASHIDGMAGIVTVVSDTLANTTWVEAEAGGTIAAGASTLEIPPGALAQDVAITVGEPISGTTMQADGMMMVGLEPSGLTFSRPATLTLSYGDTGTFDEEFLQVVAFNEQTGEWEPQEILAQNEQQNTVLVKTEHFSWRWFYIDKPIYLAMEIPGRFLKPGDILVRMQGYAPNCTGKAVWFPGHTGIYSATLGLEEQIIESNSFAGATDWNCGGWSGGVRKQTFAQFLNGTCGFYLGARRKAGASVAQQTAARDYAVERLGKGYLVVGEGNLQENCYSCVGLVEAGYDRAGASIIPTAEEFPFITPLGQFQKTIPVNEIDLTVGEQVRIPVKAIYKVVAPFEGDHYKIALLYPSATSLPTGSTYSWGVFNWTPQTGDGGRDFHVQFQAQATVDGKQYDANQSLTIHVQKVDDPTPTPVPPTPTPVPGPDQSGVLAAGWYHTCAVMDGRVKCWGANYFGQLGDGSTEDRLTPLDVVGISEATAITAGVYHTCALIAGRAKCWGANYAGQLGDGTTENRLTPVDVVGVDNITAIAAGNAHTCALITGGRVKCWGNNSLTPVEVVGLSDVTSIAAGDWNTCAVVADGVKCWGGNDYGQLGDGTTVDSLTPVDVIVVNGATTVVVGTQYSCAVVAGAVKCWGRNDWGTLGDGTRQSKLTAVDVVGVSGAKSITAGSGYGFTCAIVSGGVECWGDNSGGQLGDGTIAVRPTPVEVVGLSDVTSMTAGGWHTCAVAAGGVKCWGANSYGELGDGTTIRRLTPVDVVWP